MVVRMDRRARKRCVLFSEAQQEYSLLLSWQFLRCGPYCLKLALRQQDTFWRSAWIGNGAGTFGRIGFKSDQALPKAGATIAAVIASEVYGDSQKPCVDTAFAAKGRAIAICAQEAFLRQCVGAVGIAQQDVEHTVDAPLMTPYQFVEVFGSDTLNHI